MKAIVPVLATMAFIGAACSGDDGAAPTSTTLAADDSNTTTVAEGDTAASGGGQFFRGLRAFDSCNALLDHIKTEARDRVSPHGLDVHGGFWPSQMFGEMSAEMAVDESAAFDGALGTDALGALPASAGAGDDSEGGGFSGTNTQETSVDEPDIIKTDGERIITIRDNLMTVVDAAEGTVIGTVRLNEGWGHELFFAGDRALVFTNGGEWRTPVESAAADAEAEFTEEPFIEPGYYAPAATILEVSLDDQPSIVGTLRVEGQYLSARAVGDTVRLALSSSPQQLPWLYPANPSGEERAAEANRGVIDDSTLDDWMPSYHLVTDGIDETAPLLGCEGLHRPAEFAGFDVVTVLDFSLADGLGEGVLGRDSVGVLASGNTIYSSTDRFYVATTKWLPDVFGPGSSEADDWRRNVQTDLHSFAIATDESTRYVASGSVDGSLLNQFSIDEHDGFVRVLTTVGAPWEGASETGLTVLEEQGDELVQVGHVSGLGKGEQLFSARLLDDVGFAVTFRQIDPLYVLDLSDPTNPTVTGELKIPGFSTYLHPFGDDYVLGVGQDATEEGFQTGLKLSLFDVSNRADPREVSVWTLRDASSPAEYDHRAFQVWGDTVVLPVQSWADGFNGVILFDVGDEITELGRLSHAETTEVTGDCRLLTTSDVPEESEFFWMAQDTHTRLSLCGADATGTRGGSMYCDEIPIDEARHWFWGETDADAALDALGAEPGSRIEICYDEGDWQRSIQRSLIIDDHLWTLSSTSLQANDFESLEFIAQVPVN